MPRIVPAIATLSQHLQTLQQTPEVYRPPACPHCGLSGLWSHGCYVRKADRSPFSVGALNPIPIPRYFCQGCSHTCSRLPECIAPRRWYGWAIQQLVLQLLLVDCSGHRCAAWVGLDRRTIGRWWGWLSERSEEFAMFLKARFPELGRAEDFRAFWQGCWHAMALSEAMAWLDGEGVAVP